MLSEKSSNTVNYLKCLMCIGVVFIHSQFTPGESQLIGGGWQQVDYELFNCFCQLLSNLFLDHTCVPIFFLISGYLFFLKFDEKKWWKCITKKWKSRVKSLLVPYLIANTIYILLGRHYDISTILSGYWMDVMHHGDPPTWFLRDLISCCLLAPVIYIVIKKTDFLLPIGLLLCWFMGWWYPIIPALGLTGLLMFTLGAYLAIRKIDFVEKIRPLKLWWFYSVIYITLLVITYLSDNDIVLKVSILASFPMWISLAYMLALKLNKPCPKVLVTGTFFVFLFHYYYVTVPTTRLFLAIGGTSVPMCFVAYILGASLTVAILFSVYLLMRKYIPRLTSVIVGGR